MPSELPTAIESRFTALQTALELHARSVILKGGARDFGSDWDEAMRALGRLKGEVWRHLEDEATVRRAAVRLATHDTPPFEVSTDEQDEIAVLGDDLESTLARNWQPNPDRGDHWNGDTIAAAMGRAHGLGSQD